MDNFTLPVGAACTIEVTLRDSDGNVITTFTGSEPLAAVLWPGGSLPVSLTFACAWVTPAEALVSISLTASQMATLAIGTYFARLWIYAGTANQADGYDAQIDVISSAGTETPVTVYTTYANLLRYGRTWLTQLSTSVDEAGFAQQQGRARSWLEDIGHAHWRVAAMTLVVGGQAFGPRRSGARSQWLIEQFAANTLVLTDKVIECVSKKALAYICEGQIDGGEGSSRYAKLARMYHSQADSIASSLTMELDTTGTGVANTVIDCTSTDPMFG